MSGIHAPNIYQPSLFFVWYSHECCYIFYHLLTYMMMRSFEFMALRYLEHSQTLIIPLYVYNWNKTTHLDGFAVYDIRTKYITRRYEIPHMSKWELLSSVCSPIVPFLPARCLFSIRCLRQFCRILWKALTLRLGRTCGP